MGDPALELAAAGVAQGPSWNLRLAQQVFSNLLEQSRRHSGFRAGAQRRAARAGLSALSVDDRGLLERWLALQVLTAPAATVVDSLDVLATVEAQLAGGVRAHLPRLAARLDPGCAAIAA
ncbi:MAG: hypothetical protein J0L88_10720 [Xanthomonadales bacterium]|nr:hypothetical protein [Xanthomonadales bacterium]